jgi:hypothetical protein
VSGSDPSSKRSRGAFFTTGNPFTHPAFTAWISTIPARTRFLEPFAGAGDIPRLMREASHPRRFDLYDIAPLASNTTERDTLADFPVGYRACVTNPPYLSLHVARRRSIDTVPEIYGSYQSLYQVALDRCLEHCAYVAAIVPESFLTTGLFRTRLTDLIALGPEMFQDTDIPTSLALFGPDPAEHTVVWDRTNRLGNYDELALPALSSPCASRIRFNSPSGQLGLRATDTATAANLGFCPPAVIPQGRVNHASRLITRVHVENLTCDPTELATEANTSLAAWRSLTKDVLLTAFTSHRADGRARRRLDYATARAFLATALCTLEGCDHGAEQTPPGT